MRKKSWMTFWQKNKLIFMLWSGLLWGQSSHQIYGFITDSNSGEVLIGANVFIKETGQGMATDVNGYYVLSEIELNEATLVVSYVGYKRFEQVIDFDITSINLDIALEIEAVEFFEVDVTAEEIERLNKIEPSRIRNQIYFAPSSPYQVYLPLLNSVLD